MERTLTSILLVGWKLDVSFERNGCALSETCPCDHCVCHMDPSLFPPTYADEHWFVGTNHPSIKRLYFYIFSATQGQRLPEAAARARI